MVKIKLNIIFFVIIMLLTVLFALISTPLVEILPGDQQTIKLAEIESKILEAKQEVEYLESKLKEIHALLTEHKEFIDHLASQIPDSMSYLIPVIIEESQKHSLDPLYVISIINKESNFDPLVVNVNTNGTIDRGLMQINSGTLPYLAQALGLPATEETAFDPILNIRMGCFFLGELNKKFDGDLYLTATAYNAGERRALAGRNDYGIEIMQYYRKNKEVSDGKSN